MAVVWPFRSEYVVWNGGWGEGGVLLPLSLSLQLRNLFMGCIGHGGRARAIILSYVYCWLFNLLSEYADHGENGEGVLMVLCSVLVGVFPFNAIRRLQFFLRIHVQDDVRQKCMFLGNVTVHSLSRAHVYRSLDSQNCRSRGRLSADHARRLAIGYKQIPTPRKADEYLVVHCHCHLTRRYQNRGSDKGQSVSGKVFLFGIVMRLRRHHCC